MIIDSFGTEKQFRNGNQLSSSLSPWIGQKLQQQEEARAEDMDPLMLFKLKE
jgi:hypothetical protein